MHHCSVTWGLGMEGDIPACYQEYENEQAIPACTTLQCCWGSMRISELSQHALLCRTTWDII